MHPPPARFEAWSSQMSDSGSLKQILVANQIKKVTSKLHRILVIQWFFRWMYEKYARMYL